MASAMDERSSSSRQLEASLGQAQAACDAACAPALQHLQAALATVAGEKEPAAAALAAAMQAAVEAVNGLPPAERDLAGCVGGLGSAVCQLATGYSHVAAVLQERHKVRAGGLGASSACSIRWASLSLLLGRQR